MIARQLLGNHYVVAGASLCGCWGNAIKLLAVARVFWMANWFRMAERYLAELEKSVFHMDVA